MNPNPRSWDINNDAREALKSAVDSHGPEVLSNPQMLSNLFKDLLPDSPREASALVTAADAGVAGMLSQQALQHMDPDSAIRLTGAALAERRAIDASAGAWAAGEFARALGYLPTDQPVGASVARDSGEKHSDASTEIVGAVPPTSLPVWQPPSSPVTRPGKNRRGVAIGIIAVALVAGAIGAALALSGNGSHHNVKTSLSSSGSGSPRTAAGSPAPATTSPVTSAPVTTSPVTTSPDTASSVAPQPVESPAAAATQPTVAAASQATPAPATAAPVTAPPPPAVPAVVGLTLNAAADRLKGAGYSNIPYVYACLGSPNHGLVVTQAPAGGTAAPVSTAINLRLEANNCQTVPSVVGLDLATAANRLKSAGFNNLPYVYECLGSAAKGVVVTQSPAPGADILATDPVQLKLQANNC